MNMVKTGQFISERRTLLGMTQAELAQRLNVTDKAVSKWERGKSLPDIALLSQLACELKVSIIDILSGEISDASQSSNTGAKHPLPLAGDYACPVDLTLDLSGDVIVSPYLFGMNLEHTRSNIMHGLSAQMLRNRKFAGKPSACGGCASEWYPIGEKSVLSFTVHCYTRHHETGYHMKRDKNLELLAQRVMNPCAGAEAGIGQHEMKLRAGKEYLAAMVVKTTAPVTVTVSLTSRGGKTVYDSCEIKADAKDWTRYEVKLNPGVTDDDADIRFTFTEPVGVCFGALSLMHADHFNGMRRDVISRLKEMGVTTLRWPGGNFAGEYCWMDGLMPVDMRAPLESYMHLETQPHSMGYDYHEIGIDEYISLCREVGAQPYITINPAWNTPEENAAWVEYCNGDASTEYGRMRIERGHEEPYNVQFWSLGNEMGYGHMEGDNTPSGYARVALENGKKMLESSPHLTLCSSGPYPDKQWAELSVRPLSGISQLVSLHYYGHNPLYFDSAETEKEYYACLDSVGRMRSLTRDLRGMLDDNIKISFDEWNVWYAWYRPSSVTDGIYAALAMHILIAEAEKSGIAMACHFEAINEGMMIVGAESTELTAQGQIFSLMKHHEGGKLCRASDDVVATVDEEGIVTVTVVNGSFDKEKQVTFAGCGNCIEAALYTSDSVLPPSEFEIRDILSDITGDKLAMPPHSVLMLRFAKV